MRGHSLFLPPRRGTSPPQGSQKPSKTEPKTEEEIKDELKDLGKQGLTTLSLAYKLNNSSRFILLAILVFN